MGLLKDDQVAAVKELAKAEWPMRYLTVQIANGLNEVLSDRTLAGLPPEVPSVEVVSRNRKAIAEAFREYVNPPETWGDGLSLPTLELLEKARIDRALLVLSDLYGDTIRPGVVKRAEELGYLLGPYDSYHSIHSSDAHPDNTWQTAQFGAKPFEEGRVRNRDGSGHRGFKSRGFHFSPAAAWPYVQKRVEGIRSSMPYSTWFIDCDATSECFDDYHPEHQATRIDDTKLRRHRLRWLESAHAMVVGSEGGSALFSDVIHYGHGVHTPYIGHLEKQFRDRNSPYYLGRYWPPDTPEQSFKPVPVPPSLTTPYFDPTVRIPLYQAAFGDELIATHHWSFDSLKFQDIAVTRELLEILYMVPPMYHLNRESWAKRKDRIVRHHEFWSPIHKAVATAPLTQFEHLTPDRLVQRTTFRSGENKVTLTVNFATSEQLGHPSQSATVQGLPSVAKKIYRAK
jgi:hypothetical protein